MKYAIVKSIASSLNAHNPTSILCSTTCCFKFGHPLSGCVVLVGSAILSKLNEKNNLQLLFLSCSLSL